MTRRLAAILAADIVGYSALMAEDEAGTLEALRRLRRELFHPAVAGHRGKVVKAMGDGWLVEFSSAVDAVNAAIAVQVGLERDETIRLRLGIHLGDITHEDEDIFGDGVNVAARLEAMAEPGSVVISDAVYGSLDGTMTPSFEDGGEQRLKNIPRPVRVWRRQAAEAKRANVSLAAAASGRDYKVAITIEPFRTGDDRGEVRELAAALTGDVSRCLAEGRWYRALVSESPREGTYRLSGNIRAREERVRLETAILAPDGSAVWAGKIDGTLDDVFDWQDETAARVAADATMVIGDLERRRLDALAEAAMSVTEMVRRAQLWQASGGDETKRLISELRTAMERDDTWAMPFLLAVYFAGSRKLSGMEADLDISDEELRNWLARAEALADETPDCRANLAGLMFRDRADRDLTRFHAVMNDVLRHVPYHQEALFFSGAVPMWLGDPETALGYLRMHGTIDGSGMLKTMLAITLIQADRGDEALDAAREAIVLMPDAHYSLRALAAALAHLGRIDEAREVTAKMLRLYPAASIASMKRAAPWSDNVATRRQFDALRAAGLPEGEP